MLCTLAGQWPSSRVWCENLCQHRLCSWRAVHDTLQTATAPVWQAKAHGLREPGKFWPILMNRLTENRKDLVQLIDCGRAAKQRRSSKQLG
mmetsp:Transcript_61254/g.162840  ORF Transcript_61254/g.162840 Transcript_61254/m.162840 type:complete len:91 (+) Transcript_61254:1492-1764(+)